MAAEVDIIARIRQIVEANPNDIKGATSQIRQILTQEQSRLLSELQSATTTGSRSDLDTKLDELRSLIAQVKALEAGISQSRDPTESVQGRTGGATRAVNALGLTGGEAQAFRDLLKTGGLVDVRGLANVLSTFGQTLDSAASTASVSRDPRVQSRERTIQAQDEVATLQADLEDEEGIAAQAYKRVAKAQNEAAVLAELLAAEEGELARQYVQAQAQIAKSNAVIEARIQSELAASKTYAAALAQSAQAEAQITADKNRILASTKAYGQTLAFAARAQAQINAIKDEELASTAEYGRTLARSAVAQAKINADRDVFLANSQKYTAQIARSAIAQAQINANKNEVLAANKRYAAELARGAVAQATINADKQEDLATNQFYINEVARGAVAQAAINAGKQELLANDQFYASTLARAAVAQAQINAAKQVTLASEPTYARALADASLAQASINRQKQQELASGGRYAVELADAATAQAAINAQKKRQLLATPAYAQALAQGENLQTQINNAKKRELLLLNQGAARAEGDILDRGLRTQRNLALASDLDDPLGAASFRADKQADARRKANEAKILAADDQYIKSQAELAAANRLRAAKEQELLLVNQQYLQAQRIEAANTLRAAAVKAQAAAEEAATPEGAQARLVAVENQGVLAAQQRVEKEFQRVAELNALLGIDRFKTTLARQGVEKAIQENKLDTELNTLIRQRVELERLAVQRSAAQQVDRRQQPFKPDPTPDGGIGFVQGFRSTLRFGAASVAIYGLARGVAEAVREATELDRIFNQINRQFQSQFGEGTDQAIQNFRAFKNEVFETAELTGQAADEVANVGFQLQGAFGGDTVRAISETRDAIIAARVTGLEVAEVIDSFTALTQSFADNDLRIRQVSDAALQLQEDLGVLAKETITFAADLAPVGAELGFTAEKLAAIGAVAQQTSGRSGTALAEAFGRVLPQIQDNAIDIIQIFQSLGPEVADQVRQAFSGNDIDRVFDLLLQNFTRFDNAARGSLIDTLGGRREAQSIIGVLGQGPKVFEEYARAQNSAGKTTEYFNDLQNTLQQRVARLGEEFKRLVQTLFESGLKDFFLDFLDVLETVVRLFETFVGLGRSIGNVIGPLSGPLTTLLQGAVLLRGATALRSGIRQLSPGGAATGGSALTRNAAFLGANSAFARAAPGVGGKFLDRFQGGFVDGARLAIPRVAGLAAAVGVLYLSSVDSNVRKAAEKAAADLGSKFDSFDLDSQDGLKRFDQQVVEVSRSLGLGSGASRQRIEELLKEGKSVESLSNELGNIAEKNASLVQQIFDAAPLDLSEDISTTQAEASETVKQIYERIVKESFTVGLGQLASDPELPASFTRRFSEQLQELLDFDVAIDPGEFVDQRLGDSVTNEAKNAVTEIIRRGIEENLSFDEAFSDADREIRAIGSRVVDSDKALGAPLTESLNLLSDKAREQAETIIADLGAAQTPEDVIAVASSIQERLNEGDGYEEELVPAITEALASIFNLGKRTLEAQEKIRAAVVDLETAQAEFELGTRSAASLQEVQRALIAEYEALGTEESLIEALKLQKDLQESIFNRISDEVAAIRDLESLTGDLPFDALETRINEILASDELSIQQEGELADILINAVREQREREAAFIEDEVERARFLAAGIEDILGQEVVIAKETQILSANTKFIDALSDLTDGNQEAIDAIVRDIATASITTGQSLEDAARAVLFQRERAARLIEQTQRVIAAQTKQAQNIARLAASGQDALARATSSFYQQINENIARGFAAGQQLRDEQLSAEADRVAALAGELSTGGQISGGGTQGDIDRALADQAKAAADEADRRRREALEAAAEYARALEELREAKVDLALAEIENDPVKAASYEAFLAAAGIQTAKTQAERIRAQADKIRADRTLREAIFDVQQSQIDLLIAIADAAGQTIEAAELQIRAIREQLANARSEGLGDAQINRLKAELVGAEAALRDATLSERRDYYSFLEETGKITQAQLINYLQSLLAIPDLTQDQIRDIQREIYGLRQQLGQDFQFNLPSNLSLPTLYEVRRLDQSAGIGAGYNDNRTINLTINASTTASADDIANAVVDVMGDPTRSGTAVRRF